MEFRDFRDFKDFGSDFRTFVHRIPKEVGSSVRVIFLAGCTWLRLFEKYCIYGIKR